MGYQSCKTPGTHHLQGLDRVSDGSLSWPKRSTLCGYQSCQSLWRSLFMPFLMSLQKASSVSSTKASWTNWTFHRIHEKNQVKFAIYLPAGDEYPLLFLPPKERTIFHCRKMCPSFSEASRCKERKAAHWQMKETAKELPEHRILRCWPCTEECIIKGKAGM